LPDESLPCLAEAPSEAEGEAEGEVEGDLSVPRDAPLSGA
jgi:hypothetical protein